MNSDKITYRDDVQKTDVKIVREMVKASGFFYDDEVEVAVELVEERLAKGDRSGYYFLFAEHSGKVVGYACFGPIPCTKSSYDLYWIVVHNDYRNKGLGKILLQKSEDIISKRGGTRIYAETSSRSLYDPTRAFYRKAGYREEAVIKDFYAPGDSKIIYLKELPRPNTEDNVC